MTPPDNQKIPPPKNTNWKTRTRGLAIWVLLFAVAILLAQMFYGDRNPVLKLNYSEFMEAVEGGEVSQVKFVGKKVEGKFKLEKTVSMGKGEVTYAKFESYIPFEAPELVSTLREADVQVAAEDDSGGWWTIALSILPWLLLPLLYFLFIMRMQGNQKGIFTFGKSKAKRITPDRAKVTFADVADCEEAKMELQEVIEFLKNPKRFSKLGGKIPKGVLLLGPPGTGKTLLAKAVSGEAGVPFFSVSGSDFVEMFVGVGASRVRDLFDNAMANAPCIVFIDEIDAVGRQRGTGLGGGHDEREQTLNQILVEMDGFEANTGVIVLASTNRPDVLDPALLRAGRFDRRVVIDRPDVKGREGILKVHTRGIPLAKDVDLQAIAKGTPGLSGADLANICNEAALLAARENKDQVGQWEFEHAKDKVMMGMERRSMALSDEEKKITAYHEAGHTLVGKLLPNSDPIHKVTIIPRGMSIGQTMYLPKGDRHVYGKSYLKTKLVHALGGRAAELAVFNDPTTGADNDIKQATDLAHKMVCSWGMSEKLGPLNYNESDNEIFLGKELVSRGSRHSDEVNRLIDAEVTSLVEGALETAASIIDEHRQKLDRIAEALLKYESLSGEEIDLIMEGKAIERPDAEIEAMNTSAKKEAVPDAKKSPGTAISGDAAPEPA
ncbi:MAG TPA: ATP-dependent metallopeptidase FtsH/Yme1/Tma family protein [candidate division Zixibacteria bacterium]|nr:ATP-dependent metallopeptidase FtsH/Yme1/Tma family protein [candidate division Zixibacteria bacterium]